MKFFRTLLAASALGIATATPVMRQLLFEPTPLPMMASGPGGAPIILETPIPGMSAGPSAVETPIPGMSAGPNAVETPIPGMSAGPNAMETPIPGMSAGPNAVVGNPEPPMITPAPEPPVTLPVETPMPAINFALRTTPAPSFVEPVTVTPFVEPVVEPVVPGVTPIAESVMPSASAVAIPSASASAEASTVANPSASASAEASAAASAAAPATPPVIPRDLVFPEPSAGPGLVESPAPAPTDLVTPNGPSGIFPDVSPPIEETAAAICFPASATVTLRDGSVKPMSDVQIGDSVSVGGGKFSDVFMFTHKLSDVENSFVQLSTSSGNTLQLTAGHYLYLNGKLAAAYTARVGDDVVVEDKTASIVDVKSVMSRGLYNPQTVQGDIVVNGVLASTYTTAVHPALGHALLTPLRSVYERLGFSMKLLERGADMLANCMPKGQAVF